MLQDLYTYSTQPYMIFWTTIVCIMAFLSLASIFIGDILDIDVDGDGDIDIHGGGFLGTVMSFLDVGHVPLTFLLFTMSALNWGSGVLINSWINTGHSQTFGALLLIPVFIFSFAITKIVNIPVKKLYKAMNGDNEVKNKIIGNFCKTSTEVNTDNGYATITTQTSPLQIMVYSDEPIERGKPAVVLEFNKELNRYLISETEDIF